MEKLRRLVALYICIPVHMYRHVGWSWITNTIYRDILRLQTGRAARRQAPAWLTHLGVQPYFGAAPVARVPHQLFF